jgi:branched-chain amino acid transport system substrate-binding protein
MNTSKKLPLLIAGVAVVAVIAVLMVKKPVQEKGPPPTVAVILPLTGNTAFLGEFCKNGMELAVEQANGSGGVSGQPLKLDFADSKNEPKEGVAVFQKAMLSRPSAVVVAMSSVTSAIAPLADEQKVPLFATMVSSKGVTDNHPTMFRLFINAEIDARLMAEFAAKTKGFKNVSIVSVNDEMGASFSSVFTETFTAAGGKILAHESFDKVATEFRDVAAKIRAVPSEAIYLLGYDRNLGQLAKALREQGVTQPFLSIATIAQEPVRAVAGDALNNTFFTAVQFDADAPSGAKAKAFVAAYEKRFGKKPTYFSAFAYDSVLLLAEAMHSKGTSSENVIAGLQAIESFEGTTGTISFGGTRDARFPMTVKQISQGAISSAK